jgi:hypothetical protein
VREVDGAMTDTPVRAGRHSDRSAAGRLVDLLTKQSRDEKTEHL